MGEELKRVEDRSLTFLKYFSLFWGSIIFFVIQPAEKAVIAQNITMNFITALNVSKTDFSTVTNPDFITAFGLLVISFLIVYVLGKFAKLSLPTSIQDDKKVKEKIDKLKQTVIFALITSVLFIGYLVYLLAYQRTYNAEVTKIGFFILFLIVPVCSVIHIIKSKIIKKRFAKDWKLLTTQLVSDLVAFIFIIGWWWLPKINLLLLFAKQPILFILYFFLILFIVAYNVVRFLTYLSKQFPKWFRDSD